MATSHDDHDDAQRVRDLFAEALSCVGKARAIAEQRVHAASSESAEARRWGYVLEAAEAAEEDLRGYALDIAGGVQDASNSSTEV